MDFYNPEIKNRFIEAEFSDKPKSSVVNVTGVLHSVAVYEYQLDKDVAEFSDEELIKYIINDFCLNRSASSRNTALSRLRRYIKWYNTVIVGDDSLEYPDSLRDARTNNKNRSDIETRKEHYREMWSERYKLAEDIEDDSSAQKMLFRTEDALFQYLQFVLREERHLMYKAVAYLAYYGFDSEDIRSIEKSEVDREKHTVRERVIENDLAFSVLLEAIDAVEATNWKYIDSPYLIRRPNKGKPPTDDLRVPKSFIRAFGRVQRQAIEECGVKKYQGYVVKILMLQKYRLFFKAFADETIYGEAVVEHKIMNHGYDEYGVKLQVLEYGLWKRNAKDPQ